MTNNDKAIDKYDTDLAVMLMNAGYEDAANYLLDGPKPESRQALTPQSSADLGSVKALLEPYRGDRIHPKVNEALRLLDEVESV